MTGDYQYDKAKGKPVMVKNDNIAYDSTRDTLKVDDYSSSTGAYGTATSGTSTTLTDTSKDWETDVWKDSYVEILSGTGVGQIRKIASNTGDTITVSTAFTTAPDSTSVYRIFGSGYSVVGVKDASDTQINPSFNDFSEGYTSGATTNSYTEALSLDLRHKQKATIHIKNDSSGTAQTGLSQTDATEDSTGTTEILGAEFTVSPDTGEYVSVTSVQLDSYVSDGTGQYRWTYQKEGETETALVAATNVTATAYTTFSNTVNITSDVGKDITLRCYIKHTGDATTNTIYGKNYEEDYNINISAINYKLLSYAYSNGSISKTEESGTLNPGDTVQLSISSKLLSKVSVQVESVTADKPNNYLIEYIQGVS